MAKYGSDDVTIEYDNAGGTLADITAHVIEINGIEIEAITEETTPFGTDWVEHLAVGVNEMADIELTCIYDDGASPAPDAIFVLGALRTFKLTLGGSKTVSVETIMAAKNRNPAVKELTKLSVTLRPTGAPTEA